MQRVKRCRECTMSGIWSELNGCKVLHCDRDDLSGAPIFKLTGSEIATPQQTLFLAGRVLAIYPARRCRECLSSGDWSTKHASCPFKRLTTSRPQLSCSLDELIRIEFLQFNYVRIRIESDDGWTKICRISSFFFILAYFFFIIVFNCVKLEIN